MKLLRDFVYNVMAMIPLPVRIFMDLMGRHPMATFASSTSYYFVLSIVPLLIALLAIVPFTPLDVDTIIRFITTICPDFADEIVVQFVKAAYTQSVSLLSISVVIALWSGSKGMLGLMDGLNDIAKVEGKRGFIYTRAWALIYTIALVLVLTLMLVFLVFGDQILDLLQKAMPEMHSIWENFKGFRVLYALGPAVSLIAMMYTFIPKRRRSILSQLPGAFFCVIGWAVFSVGFSFYVNFFGSNSLYGSLATPMLLMLWLYFCVYILFIGALLNEVITDYLNSELR